MLKEVAPERIPRVFGRKFHDCNDSESIISDFGKSYIPKEVLPRSVLEGIIKMENKEKSL